MTITAEKLCNVKHYFTTSATSTTTKGHVYFKYQMSDDPLGPTSVELAFSLHVLLIFHEPFKPAYHMCAPCKLYFHQINWVNHPSLETRSYDAEHWYVTLDNPGI